MKSKRSIAIKEYTMRSFARYGLTDDQKAKPSKMKSQGNSTT